MPVILERENEATWINPDTSEDAALEILTETVSADAMEAYEVSKKVNRPTYDNASLIERV
jgi:putative SOS response-associated peptidase YedK